MSIIKSTLSQQKVAQQKVHENPGQKKQKPKILKEKTSTLIMWNKGNGQFLAKKDEMEQMVAKYQPILFAIMEANISKDAHEPALQIEGYSLERDNLCVYGGKTRTAVYVSNRISYKRRSDLEAPNTPLIWLEITTKASKPWLAAVGYRQWRRLTDQDKNQSITIKSQIARLSEWSISWTKAHAEAKPMIIFGDLNIGVCPWIKPEQSTTPYQDAHSSLLLALKTLANQLNLKLIQTEHTRFQGTDTPSTLDIILTNIPHLISPPSLIETSSDHKMVLFRKNVTVKENAPQVRRARNYKNYSKSKMLNTMNIPLLNKLLLSTDANEVAESLTNEINRALDVVAPVKCTQMRVHYAPHLSPTTKSMMTERNKIKEAARTNKTPENVSAYKKIRNLTLKMQ